MPGLGVCGSSGASTHTSAGPGGALYRRGVKKDPRTHSPKGRGLELVDDGTLSRERGRLDVMGFLEQVCTSCGPQSLSKCRMPGLGERERVLFIGTQFSILYTSMYSPAEVCVEAPEEPHTPRPGILCFERL